MEFFKNAKAVRFKSHHNKYLVADDDEKTVRQCENGSTRKARWLVELVEANPNAIRLKGCHGRYLTASDESFLLGLTGKKVLQSVPYTKNHASIEWEPTKEGHKLKLRTKAGKFLRANGGTRPWKNSITHDIPNRTATQDWVLWEVDSVDVSVLDDQYLPNNASSLSLVHDDIEDSNSPSVHQSDDNRVFENQRPPSVSVSETRRLSSVSSPENRRPSSVSASEDGRLSSVSTPENRRLSLVTASEKRWPSMGSDRSSMKSGRQGGMKFFDKAKAVRLQSHLGKYLVAEEDQETVRQSRNGSSHRARWTVELVEGKRDRIRLKSCHGLYLTASKKRFLTGMTGRKVLQTMPENKTDVLIEWEPIKEGFHVKLMTNEGKFLRANGGTPPWNNSVTHDVPHRTATQTWVLWGVDVVDIMLMDSDTGSGSLSPASSISSKLDDFSGSPDVGSPMVQDSGRPGDRSMKDDPGSSRNISSMNKVSGPEFFKKAKSVRLRSRHGKYLTADKGQESVIQDRSDSCNGAKWTVEFVEGAENLVRLKSCYGLYLMATDEEFMLGVTGQRVIQRVPRKLDSSVEWEPIRDGMQVKLKTRYGNYLRANGGLPPWRNSITHDIPNHHQDWILWDVDIVEMQPEPSPQVSRSDSEEEEEEDLWRSSYRIRLQSLESIGSFEGSPRKSEGRLIYYHIADEDGNVNDEIEGPSFLFKGHGLEDLTQRLEEETGLDDILVCTRSRANGKLYPLRLALPPNNATMNIVVVPSSSRG